jgi:hypothetical protein
VTTGGLRPAISEPLDLFPPGADPLSAQAQRRCIVAFLAIGLALRLVRYLLRFPLWEDEAMLSANLIDRGPLELLRPLDYVQVAPPLFLWGQLAATRLLGYTEYTLRLIPFLCGMGSLFLFPRVAGRLIRGTPLVLAVGLFAVSYPMTRYSAEAKQYGCDLLLALVMLALAVEWLRRPEQTGWLWALAAMVVPAVGYSFPVLFVGGGISLVVGGVLVKSRQEERRKTPGTFLGLPAHAAPADATGRKMGPSPAARAWRAWLALDLLLAVSFAVVLIVNRWAVGPSNQELMEGIWANAFPPITRPLKLIAWLAEIHAGGMLGYPVGGPNWGSTASLLAWLGGVAILARWRQGLLLGLFLAPLGLNFVAAAIHRFPYGEHARLTLYEAPAFCMLIALGAGGLVAWDAARRQKRDPASAKPQAADDPSGRVALAAGQCPASAPAIRQWRPLSLARWLPTANRPLAVALALLVALAVGSLLHDLTQPYKSGTTLRAREFARWFWVDMACDCELVCCETDLHLKEQLPPGASQWGWSALYLCNQRIYAPRHAGGESTWADRVSARRPLRCTLFRSTSNRPDTRPLEEMLHDIASRHGLVLVGRDRYPFPICNKWDRPTGTVDFIEVFKFAPRGEE